MTVHFYCEWLAFSWLELGLIQKVIFWVIPRSGAVMWFINILAIFWSFRVFGWFDYFLASLRWTCPDGKTSSGPFGLFNIGARAGLRGQSHIVKYQWSSKKNLFVKSHRLSVFSAKSNFEVKSDFLDWNQVWSRSRDWFFCVLVMMERILNLTSSLEKMR